MDTTTVLRSFGFQVLGSIGEGSYGKVKLATSERHPNEVAIKIIDPMKKAPEFISKYLPRELAILRKVRHPHIVQVFEIYKMPSREVFIVMEPAVTDLNQKIQELNFIPINQAKKWFSQLLSAMVYLHQQDIAHRDLKCENVLLTADDQVKLTDFGLGCFSKGFPDLTDTGCGTPFYAAPEVLMGELYDPKKGDVWSLGIILYVMVTGHMPFEVSSWVGLQRAQQEPLKYPEGIRVEEPCRAFISYMLHYNPRTRPSMTEVAQHPWLQSRRERAVGRFVVTVVEEDGGSSFHGDVNPLQEDVSSRADASLTCRSVEVVEEEEEEYCCFSFNPCGRAVKRAANTHVLASVLRASHSLLGRMKRFFRRNSMVHDSSSAQQGARHSAASTEAPACSTSEQRHEDGTPDVLVCEPVAEAEAVEAEPTVRSKKKSRRLRFSMFKILKKRNRLHPL